MTAVPDAHSRRRTRAVFSPAERVIAVLRGLVMDMVEEAGHGHPGTAMSLAPLMHLLINEEMRHDPTAPDWPDRDRLVLSTGHAVAILYALLHLAGYDLSLADLRSFRKPTSRTPGHPERASTPGIDATTGALGQGFANAVGMALAESMLRARFGSELCSHRTYVIVGNGDLQEGISHEAAALAGHWQLGRLVCVYNDNQMTLDGPASLSMTEDVAARFGAYGWRTSDLGDVGEDLAAIREGFRFAHADPGRPSLLILRTRVGYPSPNMTGSSRAHGQPLGPAEVALTKSLMGLPIDRSFWMPDEVVARCRERNTSRAAERAVWRQRVARHPMGSQFLAQSRRRFTGIDRALDLSWPGDDDISPRTASQRCVSRLLKDVPALVVGSADISTGTGTSAPSASDYTAVTPRGRQLRYGVREHGMGGIMTGIAYHGGLLPVGGTYLAFSDYLRPALRIAALGGARLVLSLTHDGVDCAEDGPTHHAIEHVAALRAIPGIWVLRPGDASEVAQAWSFALTADRPVVLVLGREPVGILPQIPVDAVSRGAYMIESDVDPLAVLVGTGVEVHVCLQAAALLRANGLPVRVVSAPCWELFAEQPGDYRESLLPAAVGRFVVEAGVSFGWAGRATPVAAIDNLGASGSASWLKNRFGITAERVAQTVERKLELAQHPGCGERVAVRKAGAFSSETTTGHRGELTSERKRG